MIFKETTRCLCVCVCEFEFDFVLIDVPYCRLLSQSINTYVYLIFCLHTHYRRIETLQQKKHK